MTRTSRRVAAAASSSDNETEGRRSKRARAQTQFFTDTTQQGSYERDDEEDSDGGSASEGEESNESSEDEQLPVRRKSSRSNAYRASMRDPTTSEGLIRDDEPESSSSGKKSRAKRQAKRSSLEHGDSEDEDMYDSPPRNKKKAPSKKPVVKSPAKRHSKRRKSTRVEYKPDSESSEDESLMTEDEESDEEGGEEEMEMKMNKVIACKSMTLKEWKEVCSKMNTSEVTNGSRWIQEETDESVDEETKYEERFLIKWNELSFLHCSWETEKDLVQFCEGAKGRLSTFFRKQTDGMLYEPDERLDGDYFDPSWVTIERILEEVEEEEDEDDEDGEETAIILDVNDPNFESGTGRQFQIKWGNKNYAESSYEFERDLILNEVEYKEQLESYNKRKVKPTREEMKKLESKSEMKRLFKIFGDNVKGVSDEQQEADVKEYQDILAAREFKNGGQLRDYQAEGVSWMMSNHVNKRSSILADEMGLGKTIQTATYVNTVSEQLATRGPFLIVAPLSTIPHWYREFTGWTDLNAIVYHGSASDRDFARKDEFAYPVDRESDCAFNQRYLHKVAKKWRGKWEKTWMVDVVITTPEMLVTEDYAELAAIKWEILVVDEAHRLKNHNSKLAQNLRDSRFEFNRSLLLTGTPIQNNMQELWTLLNFINPDTFDDLDDFLEHYGDIKSKEKVDELHETIRPYILRRLKEDVEKSVPPKEETLIEVELTVLQKQYYRALYEKNLKFLHRNKKSAVDGPSINNLAMQLRKCCNHPFLLTGVETEVRSQSPNTDDVDSLVNASGKLVLLDKLLPRLKADGHRILIFSQFKIMLDIIEDYLNLRDFKNERIDGSITGMKRQAAIDRFQAKDSGSREQPFIMMLSTRAGGVGINLTAADTCIIFDSDWNPQNDLQAQARCHRIGQTKNVKIYRLLTRKTYEMQMFHMSSMKMGLDQAVLQGIENSGEKDIMTKEEVEKLLKHGAYDIFKEDQDGTSEKESNDFVSQDIDSILERRAKTVVHDNTGSNSTAKGGTFSKASFKNTASTSKEGEVDVDDPDFWTKVVGEAKEEEDEELGKRKRAKQSYNEKEYLKLLDAQIKHGVDEGSDSDDASQSSEFSDFGESEDESLNLDNEALVTIVKATKAKRKDERYQWGGSSSSEWKQGDVEKIVNKALLLYGYGNIPFSQLIDKLSLSKSMKPEEMKRMLWALPLLSLLEAAEDDAQEAHRKAEAASKEKQVEGGVLAQASSGDKSNDKSADKSDDKSSDKTDDKRVIDVDMEDKEEPTKPVEKETKDLLEESFKTLLVNNESWTKKAFADAVAYSQSVTSARDKKHVQKIMDGLHPAKSSSNEENPVKIKLAADFNENVWPALRSRGWKDERKSKAKGFTHQGKTFKSITAVLDAIPKRHPELTNMTKSLISSVAASCKEADSTAPVAVLDLTNITAKSLKTFLMDCAPLQLLADRKKPKRVNLKRLLNKLVLINAVHEVVSTSDASVAKDASIEERNLHLSTLIKINPRTSRPHPEWTLLHDAILTRAATKHGWIDSNAAVAAVASDKSIRWGAPFEVDSSKAATNDKDDASDSETEKKFQAEYDKLSSTATRAGAYMKALTGTHSENLPAQVMNEIRERLIESYGLTQDELDEEWKIEESELKKLLKPSGDKAADECASLPSKRKLLKRIKRLAATFIGKGGTPEQEETEETQDTSNDLPGSNNNFGYQLIDQTDRHNILVYNMIHGLLSLNNKTKAEPVRSYTELVFNEINARIDDLNSGESDDKASLVKEWKKTKEDIKIYLQKRGKEARVAKNILRVMLGREPQAAKASTDSDKLFPTVEEKPSASSTAAKAAATKLKKKRAFTAADSALNRALSSVVEGDDGIKECLRLTSTEILILTVLASQGLPVFSEDWSTLVGNDVMMLDVDQDGEEEDFKIYFSAMGGVMQAAAEVWEKIATQKLETEMAQVNNMNNITAKEKQKIAILQKDRTSKEATLSEAQAFNGDPLSFAKKCIQLLEALRKSMGSVDTNYAGEKKTRQLNKAENGLGTKVLSWFSKDLQRWAAPLGLVDKYGCIKYETSITASRDHPQSHDAALMTKRDCRTVFIQIAQQTRLRSIFTKIKTERLSKELIPRVLKLPGFAHTEWDASPSWWNANKTNNECQDDLDLLVGILDYGYGGFDSLLLHDFPFCQRLAADGNNQSKTFTRSTAQTRVNHLTRELHGIVDTEEMMKLVQKRKSNGSESKPSSSGKKKAKLGGGGVQSGLQAFFKRAPAAEDKKKNKTPPTSPEGHPERDGPDSDVEIIEPQR